MPWGLRFYFVLAHFLTQGGTMQTQLRGDSSTIVLESVHHGVQEWRFYRG